MTRYKSNKDLPDDVREHLSKHAGNIYKEAFNSAWEAYKDRSKRKHGRTREETARAIAWSAVKRKYKKGDDGKWEEK